MASVLAIKLFLLFTEGRFDTLRPDEERNYRIAQNFDAGLGYTINGAPTAFHGSTTVFLYSTLIRAGVAKKTYITIYQFLAVAVFIASIPFLFDLLLQLAVPRGPALVATTVYALYPSNLIHIGNLFNYEKLVLPMLVIVFHGLFVMVRSAGPWSLGRTVLISTAIAVSCALRYQLVPVYGVLFITAIAAARHVQGRWGVVRPLLVTASISTLLLGAILVPSLVKNRALFGHAFLADQSGYEMMQGHNDLARGSWWGDWQDPNSSYARYSREMVPGLDGMNEYEEGQARRAFAWRWIRENPGKEARLALRKLALLFAPRNEGGGWNAVTAAVHGLFLTGLLLAAARRRWSAETWLLLSPLIAVVLLDQVYFVGYRWRYYAEPFFILLAAQQWTLELRARRRSVTS
ncbi:MAG: hypothetical protein H6595_14365 [Flavobacteriales bacterium]|nr:hypothetical protein [Flavobacteriales bacterium]MCB9168651.1 hypothetical protein [Flavobacteriales bacterium]